MSAPSSGQAATSGGHPRPAPDRTLYFARVPPCVPEANILALFQICGPVRALQLYRPWASARSSKGCGLVEFEDVEGAQAALALCGTNPWPEAFAPLTVEPAAWDKVVQAPPRRRRTRHATAPSRALPADPPAAAAAAARPEEVPGGCVPSSAPLDSSTSAPDTPPSRRMGASSEAATSSSFLASAEMAGAITAAAQQLPGAVHAASAEAHLQRSAHKFIAALCPGAAPVILHRLDRGSGCSTSTSSSTVSQGYNGEEGSGTWLDCINTSSSSINTNTIPSGDLALQLEAATGLLPPSSAQGLPLVHSQAISAEICCSLEHLPTFLTGGSAATGAAAGAGAAFMPLDGAHLWAPAFTRVQEGVVGSPGRAAGDTVGAGAAGGPGMGSTGGAAAPSRVASRLGLGVADMGAAATGWDGEGTGPEAASMPMLSAPPAGGVSCTGRPHGCSAMPCEQRVEVCMSLDRAVKVAHHAPSLAAVTGASATFSITPDGCMMLTLEGSMAAVVRAQNLVMLLL